MKTNLFNEKYWLSNKKWILYLHKKKQTFNLNKE